MDIANFLIVLVVSVVAGAFGALIGGASIVTIPTLLFMGLPPHVAIGTDRFGIIGVGAAGWLQFHKKGLINYRIGFSTAIPVLIGALIGSNLVMEIDETLLKNIIIVTNALLMVFLIINPGMGLKESDRETGRRGYLLGILLSLIVGVYGGFYGAVSGTFSMYILILVFERTFIQAAATQKVSSLMMTLSAASVFAWHGAIDYYLGAAMLIGCLAGSTLGVHYAERLGNVWIKRLFIGFMVVVLVKLILGD